MSALYDSTVSDGSSIGFSHPHVTNRGGIATVLYLGIDKIELTIPGVSSGTAGRYWRDVYDTWLRVNELSSYRGRVGLDGLLPDYKSRGIREVDHTQYAYSIGAPPPYSSSIWYNDSRVCLSKSESHPVKVIIGTRTWLSGVVGRSWLREFLADVGITLRDEPERLKRVDLAIDIPFDLGTLSHEQWRNGWVGHANPQRFFDNPLTGRLETVEVGKRGGQTAVFLRVYNKLAELAVRDASKRSFWPQIWGCVPSAVTRVEWEVRPHAAGFPGMSTLDDLLDDSHVKSLVAYLDAWGRLCVPGGDVPRSRWDLCQFWSRVRAVLTGFAEGSVPMNRVHEVHDSAEFSESAYRQLVGLMASFCVYLGQEMGRGRPATIHEVLAASRKYSHGDFQLDALSRAAEKWDGIEPE